MYRALQSHNAVGFQQNYLVNIVQGDRYVRRRRGVVSPAIRRHTKALDIRQLLDQCRLLRLDHLHDIARYSTTTW